MAMMRSLLDNLHDVSAIITKSTKLENADWSTECSEFYRQILKVLTPVFSLQRRPLPEDRPTGGRVDWSDVGLEVTI